MDEELEMPTLKEYKEQITNYDGTEVIYEEVQYYFPGGNKFYRTKEAAKADWDIYVTKRAACKECAEMISKCVSMSSALANIYKIVEGIEDSFDYTCENLNNALSKIDENTESNLAAAKELISSCASSITTINSSRKDIKNATEEVPNNSLGEKTNKYKMDLMDLNPLIQEIGTKLTEYHNDNLYIEYIAYAGIVGKAKEKFM